MDIADFLRARYHEDVHASEYKQLLYATPVPEDPHWRDVPIRSLSPAWAARAVAEAVARWNIFSAATQYLAVHGNASSPDAEPTPDIVLANHVLRQLAFPFREHPDFQPEWAIQDA